MKTLTVALVLGLGLVSTAFGQFRGLGFVRGRIVDQNGTPLTGVTFTATLPNTTGGLTGVSDSNGEWKVIGMSHGQWNITFQKPGYALGKAKVVFETELDRIPPMTITMKAAERVK